MNGLECESAQIKARLQRDMVDGRWRYGRRWYLLDTRCGCRNRWCMGMAQLRSRGAHRAGRRIKLRETRHSPVGMSDPPGHFVLFCKLQKGGLRHAKRSQRGIQSPIQMVNT